MNAEKQSAAFVGSNPLRVATQSPLLPVCNSAAWMPVHKQIPTHRCMAMLGKRG